MSRQVDSSAFIRYIDPRRSMGEVIDGEWITLLLGSVAHPAWPLLFMKASDGRRNEQPAPCLVDRVTLFAVEG
jgi:hypothetical protein